MLGGMTDLPEKNADTGHRDNGIVGSQVTGGRMHLSQCLGFVRRQLAFFKTLFVKSNQIIPAKGDLHLGIIKKSGMPVRKDRMMAWLRRHPL